MTPRWSFEADLWIWPARRDTWNLVALPADVSEEIREASTAPPRGFGSVPVVVTIGSSAWRTSVFPDSARGVFVLPVGKAVLAREGLATGDVIAVDVELVV